MTWKTIDSKIVFENDWMRVHDDNVINPRGGRNSYAWVHFKNRALAIVPLSNDGDTWLVGQHRYTLAEYSWEIPMGGGKLDEEPLVGAKRELREETGLSAKRWTELMSLATSNSITDERFVIFLAEDLSEGETEFDETEALEIRRLPLSEALDMVNNGEITDAVSVAALLKVGAVR